jgi:hypothetical protein
VSPKIQAQNMGTRNHSLRGGFVSATARGKNSGRWRASWARTARERRRDDGLGSI